MQGEGSRGKTAKSKGLYGEMPYESASSSDEDEASEPGYDDVDEASDADGAAAGNWEGCKLLSRLVLRDGALLMLPLLNPASAAPP